MKPAPIPWILCGPGAPPEITGEWTGSTATSRSAGFFGFQYRPTPVSVPPVPTPATKTSIFPSVSFQSSTAVVASWIAGFAGFSNCCGIDAVRAEPGEDLARLRDRALHPLRRRRQDDLGAEEAEDLPPLERHRLGHRDDEPVPLRRRGERERDAGVPRGRLDEDGLAGRDPSRRAPAPRSSRRRSGPSPSWPG